jgi:hypothetical protein
LPIDIGQRRWIRPAGWSWNPSSRQKPQPFFSSSRGCVELYRLKTFHSDCHCTNFRQSRQNFNGALQDSRTCPPDLLPSSVLFFRLAQQAVAVEPVPLDRILPLCRDFSPSTPKRRCSSLHSFLSLSLRMPDQHSFRFFFSVGFSSLLASSQTRSMDA